MNIYGLLIAALMPLSLFAQASDLAESDLLKKLKAELDNKNYSVVLELAEQYQDQHLGEPEFDFIFGVAALESGRGELSVFAFERVVANKPAWLDARLYLAKAYYESSNYQSALEHCKNIIASTSSTNKLHQLAIQICSRAEQKLAQQATIIKHSVNTTLGYDSNLNAGTREEKIFLPFLDDFINLDEESTKKSDEFLQLNYQFNMSTALTQTSTLNINTQVNAHNFINENDYNRLVAQVGVDYTAKLALFAINIGARITPLWFDGHYYRMQSALLTGLQTQIGNNWALSGSLMLGKTNNNQNKLLDTDDYSLGIASSYFQGNWRHSINFEHLEEDGIIDSNSRTIDSVSINSLWLVNQQWLASLGLSFQAHDYRGKHPFYLKKREDDVWLLSSFIQHSYSKSLSFRLNMNMQDKDSNLDLFSYDRAEVSLSARMNF